MSKSSRGVGDETLLHWMLKTGVGGFKLDALGMALRGRRHE
jgi:hypothetical protein